MFQNFSKIIATCLINQKHIFLEVSSSRGNTQVQQEKEKIKFCSCVYIIGVSTFTNTYEFKHTRKMITHGLNNDPG